MFQVTRGAGPFGPNRAVKVVTEANGRVNPLAVGCLQHSRHNVEYLLLELIQNPHQKCAHVRILVATYLWDNGLEISSTAADRV